MSQTITAIQARTAKTAAEAPFEGTHHDSSALAGEFMLQLRVRKLESSDGTVPKALFDLEGSTDNFVTKVVYKTWQVVGPIHLTRPETEFKENVTKRELQLMPVNVAGSEFRVVFRSASANSSVSYEMFMFS